MLLRSRMRWTVGELLKRTGAALAASALALALGTGCGSPAPDREAAKGKATASATTADATAKPTPALAPAPTLAISPMAATLKNDDLGVQLVLTGINDWAGRPIDLTKAAWKAEPADAVSIEPGGYVRPRDSSSPSGAVKDKPTVVTITAAVGGSTAKTTLKLDNAGERPWNFGEDVVPILTKAGCNGGGCHGKLDGQNGFKLSLFGYYPESDHHAMTRDQGGRRIDRFDPASSLILRKATGQDGHAGGRRLEPRSDEYAVLSQWIKDGAPYQRGQGHGGLLKVEVVPAQVRLTEPGEQQLRVVAKYKDGHERDVTRLSSFRSNDDSTLTIDGQGLAKLSRRAEADLVTRYQSQVAAIRLATVINPSLKHDFAAWPRRNFIDEKLIARLESLKVPPSPPADDAVFMRRVTLDLTGQTPMPQRVREYMSTTDKEGKPVDLRLKKEKLVDELLASRDFASFWLLKFGDLLRVTNGAYEGWLRKRIATNQPLLLDQLAQSLLTAVGEIEQFETGAANYALDGEDAKVKAERTAQRFLGLRLRCAQCHDHPFDVWTQDDYYGMAAIFAKTMVSPPDQAPNPANMMAKPTVRVIPTATIEHLRTKKAAEPRILDGTPIKAKGTEDPRKELADWMIKPDNPYFSKAMANWTWAQFFGRGIAEPADDLSQSNPPVHPELLDALAKHLVERKFDLRQLIRTIVLSEAYAMSSSPIPANEADSRLFSHQTPRPLTAHQIADAIVQATGVPIKFVANRTDLKAIQVFDPNLASPILDTFGRCKRVNGCAAAPTPQLSLRQALLLIGSGLIDDQVGGLDSYLTHALDLGQSPEELVENLYFRTLCRKPAAEELSYWTAELKAALQLREAAEDLFWALLNSREFAFNQ